MRSVISCGRVPLLCAVSLLALAPLTARAEQAGPQNAEAAAQAETSALDAPITVTARKREESIQTTPISITAFSGAGLEARGIQSTDRLAEVTPNLTLQNNPSFSGASNSASIYIRGVGQQDFVPTVEPGVGVYVDGVYVARSVGAILGIVHCRDGWACVWNVSGFNQRCDGSKCSSRRGGSRADVRGGRVVELDWHYTRNRPLPIRAITGTPQDQPWRSA